MLTITITLEQFLIFLGIWLLIGCLWIIIFKNSKDTNVPIPLAIAGGPTLFVLYFLVVIYCIKENKKKKLQTLKGQREYKLKKLKRKNLFRI